MGRRECCIKRRRRVWLNGGNILTIDTPFTTYEQRLALCGAPAAARRHHDADAIRIRKDASTLHASGHRCDHRDTGKSVDSARL